MFVSFLPVERLFAENEPLHRSQSYRKRTHWRQHQISRNFGDLGQKDGQVQGDVVYSK